MWISELDMLLDVLGDHSDSFSVQLFQGGFFISNGTNHDCVDAKTVWYDFCEMDKWSPLVVENIVVDLWYEMVGRVKVYWLCPGKTVNEDGLVPIKKDADTNCMVSMVQFGHRFLDMYLDHDDNLNGYNRDDIIAYHADQTPPVVNPSELSYVPPQKGEKLQLLDTNMQSSSRVTNHGDNESDIDSEDSDFVPQLMDGDYDLDDGDDDLYDDYVDDLDNLKGKQVAEPLEDSEEDEIQLPDSDEEEMRFNFKKFREEDMHNLKFYVGQVFSSIDMLRKAINEYSCKNRVDIKKQPMRVQCWVQSVQKKVVLGTFGFLRIAE